MNTYEEYIEFLNSQSVVAIKNACICLDQRLVIEDGVIVDIVKENIK